MKSKICIKTRNIIFGITLIPFYPMFLLIVILVWLGNDEYSFKGLFKFFNFPMRLFNKNYDYKYIWYQ